MTRIAVFAYADVGHACVKLLLDRGENVVLVATHADDPAETRWFDSVADLARGHGVEPVVFGEAGGAAALARVRAAAPDLIFSFYYRDLLPAPLLQAARLGAFNMHGSLLPRYRGRAPVNWAVVNGETRTGATLHVMTEKADAGDIVDQEAVVIGPDDTALDVQRRVTAAAMEILGRRLEDVKAGRAPRRPQNEALATTFPRRRPEDGRIEWSKKASEEVHNLVRAVTHPYPGAFSDVLGAGRVTIWKTRVPNLAAHDNFPGQIRQEQGHLYVACADDHYVEILSLQREGGLEVAAQDFRIDLRDTR